MLATIKLVWLLLAASQLAIVEMAQSSNFDLDTNPIVAIANKAGVKVRGRLLCGRIPYANARIKLVKVDEREFRVVQIASHTRRPPI